MPTRQQAGLAELKRQQREQAKEIMRLRHTAERVKLMERQLRENRDAIADINELETMLGHYRDLFEGAPEAYLVTDGDSNVKEANQAAGVLLGAPPTRLVGLALTSFLSEADRRVLRGKLSDARRSQSVERCEMQLCPFWRPAFFAAISVSVARDPAGRASTFRWCIHDESHRQEAGGAIAAVPVVV